MRPVREVRRVSQTLGVQPAGFAAHFFAAQGFDAQGLAAQGLAAHPAFFFAFFAFLALAEQPCAEQVPEAWATEGTAATASPPAIAINAAMFKDLDIFTLLIMIILFVFGAMFAASAAARIDAPWCSSTCNSNQSSYERLNSSSAHILVRSEMNYGHISADSFLFSGFAASARKKPDSIA
jgi:hypothetical protein